MDLPPSGEDKILTLHTADGREALQRKAGPGQERIDVDVSELTGGLYHLSVRDGDTVFGSRVVVR